MPIHHVSEPSDPRLTPYRDLKNRPPIRKANGGQFIAEGPHLVGRLIESDLEVESILIGSKHRERFAHLASGSAEVFVAEEATLEALVGFHFHRGVLACGARPARQSLDELLGAPPPQATYVVCPEINDPENLGTIFRAAGGFGVTAVLVGERCCDPFSRRCLRVSMGAVFDLTVVESTDLAHDLTALRDGGGVELVGAVIEEDAIPLPDFRRSARTAILLGTEAEGLHARFAKLCDRSVTIPMHGPSDSLNVGAAAAVVLYAFDASRPGSPISNRPPL